MSTIGRGRSWGPAGRGLASFLFAYPSRPHRRERLADLFWPELDAERARRALNSAIWRMRKLLASEPGSAGGRNLLTIGTETILERAPWLDIDATALHEAATMALRQPETLLDHNKLNHVAAVLHRYEGPFLDGDDGDWILGGSASACIRCFCARPPWWCAGWARLVSMTMQLRWRGARCGSIHIGKNWCATC